MDRMIEGSPDPEPMSTKILAVGGIKEERRMQS